MKNFEDFGLKSGSFKTLPSDKSVKHWAGMPEAKKKLTDIIQSVRSDDIGQSEFVIMCSAYGGGKTHAMRYFVREIIENGDGYAFFAGEILHGHKTTFLGVFHHIIQKNKKMLPDLVARVVSAVDTEVRLARAAAKDADTVNEKDYQKKIIEDNVAGDDNAALVSKFVDVPRDSDSIVAILIDGKVVSDDYSAASMLATLIGVMTSPIGNQPALYKAAYIFFDEMEISLNLKPADQFSFFGALRQLINGTADSYCGILLAFTTETAHLEQDVEPFLWERMTRPLWEFENLDDESAKKFAQDYLGTIRLEEASPSQPFFPFAEGVIDFIIERRSQVVPRYILRDMGQLFERAVRDERVAPGNEFSRELAEDILNTLDL